MCSQNQIRDPILFLWWSDLTVRQNMLAPPTVRGTIPKEINADVHEDEQAAGPAVGGAVLGSKRQAELQRGDHAPQPRRGDMHEPPRWSKKQQE